jgi:hypothetical protein
VVLCPDDSEPVRFPLNLNALKLTAGALPN